MEIYEIEKKTAGWSDSTNNYEIRKNATPENGAEFRELTVTITLSEYRNEYIEACRTNYGKGSRIKKEVEELIKKMQQPEITTLRKQTSGGEKRKRSARSRRQKSKH